MSKAVDVIVNGEIVSAPTGSTVAVAIALAGVACRAPICGMGICFECCATINGRAHIRSCQVICEPGMEIRTDG